MALNTAEWKKRFMYLNTKNCDKGFVVVVVVVVVALWLIRCKRKMSGVSFQNQSGHIFFF